jgi:hypothetical protein
MRSGTNRRSAIAAAILSICCSATAMAQESNYGLFEAQRRDAISRQLGLQEELRAWSGLPSRLFPGFRPYSLESIYAGLNTPAGAAAWGSPDVFEPWPFVPGDIWGRQFDFATPTPLGHVVTPTGPNGYRYEPYYSWQLPTAPRIVPSVPRIVPPAATPPAPTPAVRQSAPEELPPPSTSGEVREF